MPSSHSTNLFFLSVYLWQTLPPELLPLSLAAVIAAVVLSAHRVRAHHHTVAQVVVGEKKKVTMDHRGVC